MTARANPRAGKARPQVDPGLDRAPWLPQLRTLRLDGAGLDDNAARALASRELPELGELSLPHNEITAAGVAALAAGQMPQLHSLELQGNPTIKTRAMTITELRALTKGKSLPHLQTLATPTMLSLTTAQNKWIAEHATVFIKTRAS